MEPMNTFLNIEQKCIKNLLDNSKKLIENTEESTGYYRVDIDVMNEFIKSYINLLNFIEKESVNEKRSY
jgi:hypothetical protein